MLTPYQFASNRPVDGVDLDGLEYLRADEARIKMIGGETHINLENFNSGTRGAWRLRDARGIWPTGYIGFPTKLGELTHPSLPVAPPPANLDNTLGAPNPNFVTGQLNVQNPRTKQSGYKLVDRRYKNRTLSGLSGGGKVSAGISFALNAVTFGLEQYGIFQQNEDKRLVNEHRRILSEYVARDLDDALQMGIIPEKYQNIRDLGSISNVILSGVNPTDNQEIYDIGIKIVKEISENFRYPLKMQHLDSGSELMPADNTRIAPIAVPEIEEK